MRAFDDLHPAASGLVRDCRYFSLDNFRAVGDAALGPELLVLKSQLTT